MCAYGLFQFYVAAFPRSFRNNKELTIVSVRAPNAYRLEKY